MNTLINPIILGADHAGSDLKNALVAWLRAEGHTVVDVPSHVDQPVDYPRVSQQVIDQMRAEGLPRAILCCGSGVGVSIAANRYAGIRAVLTDNPYVARLSREHNDANVLCLGGRFVAPHLAYEIVREFLETPFSGDRHQSRVDQLDNVAC
jgi:ribose 5-phosphate isomerase B